VTYAAATTVPVEKTKVEIERLVIQHKATEYVAGWQTADPPRAAVQFRMADRYVRFEVPMPHPNEPKYPKFDARRRERMLDQDTRSRWRALLLVIKAKLESVASGIETFDEAFLAQVVMPGGATVSATLIPQLAAAYRDNTMPRLLPAQAGKDTP
jgi:hypothetical protein